MHVLCVCLAYACSMGLPHICISHVSASHTQILFVCLAYACSMCLPHICMFCVSTAHMHVLCVCLTQCVCLTYACSMCLPHICMFHVSASPTSVSLRGSRSSTWSCLVMHVNAEVFIVHIHLHVSTCTLQPIVTSPVWFSLCIDSLDCSGVYRCVLHQACMVR